jgi:hypothetical protein
MIEKGFVNEDTQAIFKTNTTHNKYGSLKWGLLALSGVSLILIDFFDVRPTRHFHSGYWLSDCPLVSSRIT